MKYFENSTILKILDYYKNIWAINHVSAVSHWDLETYMPSSGASARGEALGRLATIKQKMFLDPSFTKLITLAGKEKLNDYESGVIRDLENSLKIYKKVPPAFLEEFEKLTNTGTVIWREAKLKKDFSVFEKTLEKIFDMNRQMAEYIGYKDSPYDALLDLYEPELTTNKVGPFFDEIKKPLYELLNKIVNSKVYKTQNERVRPLQDAVYDKQKMEELNNNVLDYLWSDKNRFRMDVSSHPFTTSFSNNDTRITTWYHQKDFARSLLATIHEFGHALYDLQSPDGLEMTPIAGGSSLVIHESQSRFWENHVGRSMEFIERFKKDMEQVVGCELSAEDVYHYFNKVSPSLLRVEADELTYHFHIMLRFEIEKGIIEGNLKVKDLPEIWNSKMKEYLGISPKDDSEGVLQDIHWSGGSVGYFPTYSLGTFLASQWRSEITNAKLKITNCEQTKNFLKQNVHQFGSTYTLEELLRKNNMKFDPSVNIKYLQEKYTKLYSL